MYGQLHPFSKALYEQDGEGNVRITMPDGRTARVHLDGSYLEGDLFDVDPQMCGWVGGPRAQHRLQSEPKVS